MDTSVSTPNLAATALALLLLTDFLPSYPVETGADLTFRYTGNAAPYRHRRHRP